MRLVLAILEEARMLPEDSREGLEFIRSLDTRYA